MVARGETSGSRRHIFNGALEARPGSPRVSDARNPDYVLVQTFHVWLPSSRRFAAKPDVVALRRIRTSPRCGANQFRYAAGTFQFSIRASQMRVDGSQR
ncbi:MAG TPA: hypothetical protein VLL54_09645 [Pyrinomonadaceae bacterium]|nr:hypothetical protein [Pyrinomonadaceae bacterium]